MAAKIAEYFRSEPNINYIRALILVRASRTSSYYCTAGPFFTKLEQTNA
jgi:hypothetical protein